MALVFCTRCGHRVSTTAQKCPSCGTPPYRSRVASTASTDPPTNDATAPRTTPESAAPHRGSRIAGQLFGWTLAIVVIGGLYNVLNKTSTARTTGSSPPSTEPEAGSSAAETGPAPPSILPPKFDIAIHTGGGNSDAIDDQYGIRRVKMVLTDDRPTTILRIIVNGRVGATGDCDFVSGDPFIFVDSDNLMGQPPRPEPRLRLNTGDYVLVPASCGELVTLKIVTDRGTVNYRFR